MRRPFPAGFVWGVATSAYQVEGAHDADGRGWSIWDELCRRPGAVRNGDTGDHASRHLERLDDDLDLLVELGVGAYRFSVAWPRVLPAGTGEVNPAGLDLYDRLVDGLLERGIEPYPTLYHWDLPQALEERGGWRTPEVAHWFADYAVAVHARLGDRVRRWATLNEPWCTAYLGHATAEHAPGVVDAAAAVAAAHHTMLAHARAVLALRDVAGPAAEVGVVLNPAPVRADPADPVDGDVLRRIDGTLNRWFLDAALRGEYPADVLEDLGPWAAPVRPEHLDVLAEALPLAWLGVNYYNDHAFRPGPPDGCTPHVTAPEARPAPVTGATTDLGWPITPSGLTDLLVRLARDYPQLPAVVVTENGAAFDDPVVDGRCADPRRIAYLRAHLEAVHDAIDLGVGVEGYLAWSFLDNFEWAHGYAMRFGLVHVEFASGARTVRDSGHWYGRVCRGGGLPD